MTELRDKDIEMALDALAREVAEATPRPSADLTARVLADAAAMVPAQPASAPVKRSAAPTLRLREMFFGWTSGAVAAMAVALVIGMGVGMQIEAGTLPFLEEEDDDVIIVADGAAMPEEFL